MTAGCATATQLSVIIVNFCQWQNTARLTKQLRHSDVARSDTAEIVIIDNHSPPHPLRDRISKVRGVKLLSNPRNLGFAEAVNRGCRESSGEWVLLLNPDVTVGDGFLDDVQKLMDSLENSPTLGVLGFQLRNADGTPQASTGPFPTFSRTLRGLIRPRSRRKCQHQNGTHRQRVDWVTGGCLLVRRECLQDLNGLDERYFLYYEDVDFCRRATERGWAVAYEPNLSVRHHSPLHSRAVPAPLRLITRHALMMYAAVHWPRWQAKLLGMLISMEARVRSLASTTAQSPTWQSLRMLPAEILARQNFAVAERIRGAAVTLDRFAAAQDRSDAAD